MTAPAAVITHPRRGIRDPQWRYRRACETNIAATFKAERARLARAALEAQAAAQTATEPAPPPITLVALPAGHLPLARYFKLA